MLDDYSEPKSSDKTKEHELKHDIYTDKRLIAQLSPDEFKPIAALNLGDTMPDTARGIFYRLASIGEIRCRIRKIPNELGSLRDISTYALGSPKTPEEIKYMAWAQEHQQRKRAKAMAKRAKKPKPVKVAKPSKEKPEPPKPVFVPRSDPMIWATAGRKIPRAAA